MGKAKNLIYRVVLQSHFAGVATQATSLFVMAVTRGMVFSQ
jgi:hypothetical protein